MNLNQDIIDELWPYGRAVCGDIRRYILSETSFVFLKIPACQKRLQPSDNQNSYLQRIKKPIYQE